MIDSIVHGISQTVIDNALHLQHVGVNLDVDVDVNLDMDVDVGVNLDVDVDVDMGVNLDVGMNLDVDVDDFAYRVLCLLYNLRAHMLKP